MNTHQSLTTYQEALDYLTDQLPMFQKKGDTALKKGLRNIEALDEFLDHPHQQYPSIHIAGTNGKGSTAHMLAAIFQAAGYRVGLYTSPHYRDFRERIKVNGQLAEEQFVIDFLNRMKSQVREIRPSFFELSVAMAFQYFAEKKVDIAIVETGLGGRTDSTNIITPILSLITNISYDHQSVLGDTLEEIASHKAGIIKAGVPAVISETHIETREVFLLEASLKDAPIIFADQHWQAKMLERTLHLTTYRIFYHNHIWLDRLSCELQGDYQRYNLQAVFQTIETINERAVFSKKIEKAHIQKGLEQLRELTRFIGRWQLLEEKPFVLVDSAHNIGGMTHAVQQLSDLSYENLHFVLGMVKDKEIEQVLSILPKEATYYFAKADVPRGLEAHLLAEKAKKHQLRGEVCGSVSEALERAKQNAGANDLIFVGGSIYVVAEIV